MVLVMMIKNQIELERKKLYNDHRAIPERGAKNPASHWLQK
jgi:hypothetical protein